MRMHTLCTFFSAAAPIFELDHLLYRNVAGLTEKVARHFCFRLTNRFLTNNFSQ